MTRGISDDIDPACLSNTNEGYITNVRSRTCLKAIEIGLMVVCKLVPPISRLYWVRVSVSEEPTRVLPKGYKRMLDQFFYEV